MGVLKDAYDIANDIREKASQSLHKRREHNHVEKVLSVMTEGKTWRRSEIVTLSKISDEDVLRVLRGLRDADRVIAINVDEEPNGTFWRRI